MSPSVSRRTVRSWIASSVVPGLTASIALLLHGEAELVELALRLRELARDRERPRHVGGVPVVLAARRPRGRPRRPRARRRRRGSGGWSSSRRRPRWCRSPGRSRRGAGRRTRSPPAPGARAARRAVAHRRHVGLGGDLRGAAELRDLVRRLHEPQLVHDPPGLHDRLRRAACRCGRAARSSARTRAIRASQAGSCPSRHQSVGAPSSSAASFASSSATGNASSAPTISFAPSTPTRTPFQISFSRSRGRTKSTSFRSPPRATRSGARPSARRARSPRRSRSPAGTGTRCRRSAASRRRRGAASRRRPAAPSPRRCGRGGRRGASDRRPWTGSI